MKRSEVPPGAVGTESETIVAQKVYPSFFLACSDFEIFQVEVLI